MKSEKETKYLLAIDIGNTNVTIGVFKKLKLLSKRYVPTKRAFSYTHCRKSLDGIPYKKNIDCAIISSVAPKALINVKKWARKNFGKNVFILGENIKPPIKNMYKRPRQVGSDRLANGVGAYCRYKGGIVIDFGTAVTFDVITSKNEYLGGLIFPGIRLSLENLSLKAALLPKIKLKPTRFLVGKDTITSMTSGIINGYAALCDNLASRLKAEYGRTLKVIATGGDAALIGRYCNSIDIVDENLTLRGLALTYYKRLNQQSINR